MRVRSATWRSRSSLAAALCAAAALLSGPALASNPYLVIPAPSEAKSSRAYRYANLSNEEAYAELQARGIPFEHARPPLPGVRAPIRLTGPLHGVTVHSSLPAAERRASPFEILDARLALALDDFCEILARHDVVELVHFTMYRPSVVLPTDAGAPQPRHPGGLAVDVGGLRKRSGRWISVGPHWPSKIGAKTCGPGALEYKSRPTRELVSIVCETADLRIFHYMLTPHFNELHADHLHLEIKPEVKWFLVN